MSYEQLKGKKSSKVTGTVEDGGVSTAKIAAIQDAMTSEHFRT
jgi:hypothetical protein